VQNTLQTKLTNPTVRRQRKSPHCRSQRLGRTPLTAALQVAIVGDSQARYIFRALAAALGVPVPPGGEKHADILPLDTPPGGASRTPVLTGHVSSFPPY
jgi:hypothetical protein